jgi:hypothetical protein
VTAAEALARVFANPQVEVVNLAPEDGDEVRTHLGRDGLVALYDSEDLMVVAPADFEIGA